MITNKWFCGIENAPEAKMLRRAVFVEEQGFPGEEELDVLDDQAMHAVIYDEEKPVATGRVYHDGKTFCIGRICVAKEVRGQGIGDLLVKLLLVKAFEFDPSQVRVVSQDRVKDFYKTFGFEVCGEQIDDSGVAHVPMCVTKDTLVFRSGCGKEMRFADIFPEKQ